MRMIKLLQYVHFLENNYLIDVLVISAVRIKASDCLRTKKTFLTACLRIREYAKTKAALHSNTAKIIPVWPFSLMSKFQDL